MTSQSLPRILLLIVAFAWIEASAASEPLQQKILLVVSGHGRDAGKTQPGFEFDEFAQAWAVFRDHGLRVETGSPRGGPAEADAYEPEKIYNARVAADAAAIASLKETRRLGDIQPGEFAAIFVLGGGGAMFDLMTDPALQSLLARTHEKGGVVGGVCHGPAVFAGVQLADGTPLVQGRRVTGFTNAEEAAFGSRWAKQYPKLLEDALTQSGAIFKQGEPMLPFVVSDGRLVTGQNPYSTAQTAEAMLRALGIEPKQRDLYPDERSLMAIGRVLRGEAGAVDAEISATPAAHDLMLIGMYGANRARQAAGDRGKLETAVSLMKIASARVSHPRLEMALATAEHGIGRTSAARDRLQTLLARDPANEPAKRLLQSLEETPR